MTVKDLAQRLARALQKQHPALIQNYALSHIEYTLHRELNALSVDKNSAPEKCEQ